jgi:hypothetical protein
VRCVGCPRSETRRAYRQAEDEFFAQQGHQQQDHDDEDVERQTEHGHRGGALGVGNFGGAKDGDLQGAGAWRQRHATGR